MVTRSQSDEIWVLWGSCQWLFSCCSGWFSREAQSHISPAQTMSCARVSSTFLKLRPRPSSRSAPNSAFIFHFLLSLVPLSVAPLFLLFLCLLGLSLHPPFLAHFLSFCCPLSPLMYCSYSFSHSPPLSIAVYSRSIFHPPHLHFPPP